MEHIIGRYDIGENTVEVGSSSKSLTVGEPVDIDVRLTDKNGDRSIDKVELEVQVYYWTGDTYRKATVVRRTLVEDLSVESGITETRRTAITLPYETPSTIGSVDAVATTRFHTGGGVEEQQRYLEIVPTAHFEAVFDSILDLGLRLRNVECRIDRTPDDQQFINKFDFRPVDDPFEDEFDRMELFVRTKPAEVTLYVTVDHDDGPTPVPQSSGAKTVIRSTERETVGDQLESFILQNASD